MADNAQPGFYQDPRFDPSFDPRFDQRFDRAMALAPRPILTPLLIAINTAVFLAMLARGFHFDGAADSYLAWGADFGPAVTHGEWWRVLTSVFLHANFLHLAMNMYVLWLVGQFTERLFGRVGFTALYLLAGVGGSLTSLAWQPFTVSMGASGAVFGLYGGLVAVLILHRHTVPRQRLVGLAKSAAIFIVGNLIFGFTQSNVDMAAHLGGLASGFLIGLALTGPLVPADPDWRQLRPLVVALAGAAIAFGAITRMPVVDDWRSDVERLVQLDNKTEKSYDDALHQVQIHRMQPAEFAALIQKQILPPWIAERSNLAKLKLSPPQRALADLLTQYMTLRAEAWSLMGGAVLATDVDMTKRSFQKQHAAEAVLQQINQQFNSPTTPGGH